MSEFQWPCEKRTAHEAHPIYGEMVLQTGDGKEHPIVVGQCPGVKAHPNTMIGRQVSEGRRPSWPRPGREPHSRDE